MTKLQLHEILNLLLPSDEFELQPLITYIQETLIKNHDDFITKNIYEIVELAYQKKSFSKLWDYCIQKICYKPACLFESTKFLTLNPAILEIILKRDYFYVDNEIVIWEKLLKWACGQQPIIQQDINKWNKNDFTVMERRLSRFVPLVRFYHISSEDFLLKIYPFKEILPNDLINNILAYHMAPNNKPNINIQLPRFLGSVIIKFQHLNIFASWIDRKETLHYNEIEHIPYRFELLYHFNKNDGTTIATFHEKCDNKGPTIVIAKVTNSEQIIGGYNPLQWDSSNSYKSTNDSFIFSFTDRTNLQSAKVGYIINNNNQYSIYCGLGYGPTFGEDSEDSEDELFSKRKRSRRGGHDLYCQNNVTWTSNNPYSYSKIDIPYSFNVGNYEVFQVIKK